MDMDRDRDRDSKYVPGLKAIKGKNEMKRGVAAGFCLLMTDTCTCGCGFGDVIVLST